jgi:hypothetical protein
MDQRGSMGWNDWLQGCQCGMVWLAIQAHSAYDFYLLK